MKWLKGFIGVLGIVGLAALPVQATTFTLTDLNSVFQLDSADGANGWWVEGVSQLYEQAFWFRVGDTGPESRLGDYFSNGWVDQSGRIATLQYTHSLFTAEIVYVLTGGTVGSGTSDVAETIRIRNMSSTGISMRFFQYCDFDLNGTPGDDRLYFANQNSVRQSDMGGGPTLSETVVTPVPSHHEGDLFSATRDRLDDDTPTTLNDLPNYGNSIVGDVTWAFEWDRYLPVNGTLLISKDKHLDVVPEPGTLLLLGVGLVGAEVARRRRKKA